MKIFNSIQVVALYAAWPFLVSWLADATFPWHEAAFWAAAIAYVPASIAMVAAVYSGADSL